MIRLTLLLTILFAASAQALVVDFRPTAEVADSGVTLGDIAKLDEETEFSHALASQIIAQAPAPGQEAVLQTKEVIRHLKGSLDSASPVQWQGAPTITVRRLANTVQPSDIMAIIDHYLSDTTGQLGFTKIRFIPEAQPLPFSLPAGKLSWQVIPSDPKIINSSRFSLIFKVDDRVRRNMSIRGKMEVLAPVVVSSQDIRRGTVLGPQHLSTQVMEISGLREPITKAEDAIGKRLLVSSRAGTALAGHQLEAPPLIERGELVRMILKKGSLFITATGVARSAGAANQTIRVQNTGSQKIVYCRVAAPGVVEVVR